MPQMMATTSSGNSTNLPPSVILPSGIHVPHLQLRDENNKVIQVGGLSLDS